MKLYLAGPMTGIPEFNFPEFYRVAALLRAAGHFVYSPAESNIEDHGELSKSNQTGDEDQAVKQYGFDRRKAMAKSLAWICSDAEAVAMLPGWENSPGAVAERAAGLAVRIPVRLYTEYM